MIILIQKSELFTTDPDVRFSKIYGVPRGTWKELWRRKVMLDYTNAELADYFQIKTGRRISRQNVKRWVNRTKVYMKIFPIVKMGAQAVQSDLFVDMEWFVIKELAKNIKNSVKKNPKSLA